MALPTFITNLQPFQLMQTKWKAALDPVIQNPILSGQQLNSVPLVSGTNVINHGLGTNLQGWILVRKRQWLSTGTPTVYDVTDVQDSNAQPNLTLKLYCTQGTSSNPALVDLWVY